MISECFDGYRTNFIDGLRADLSSGDLDKVSLIIFDDKLRPTVDATKDSGFCREYFLRWTFPVWPGDVDLFRCPTLPA